MKDDADQARRLRVRRLQSKLKHAVLLRLNCPQHTTPRFREPELAQALEPVSYRILDLESEMRAFRAASSNPVSPASS